MPDEVLDRRALNRALLARQSLLERGDGPAIEIIERLVGLQAQAPNPPYIGLWTRITDFHHDDLSSLIIDRTVVRIAVMRGTIHVVSARDCLGLRALIQPVLDRAVKTSYLKRLVGLDHAEISAAGRELVEQQPRTFAELGVLLAQRWPDHDADALAQTIRAMVPLVQVPPRGIWGASGQAAHTSAEAWLPEAPEARMTLADLVIRYLAAFGPASVKDIQFWSGLTRLREVVDGLRPGLRTFRDENGVEVFDLPDAPRPDPDTPVPPRFVAEFDNLLLSHADRARILTDDQRKRIFTVNGLIPGTILIDGFVAGTWKITVQRKAATLTIAPFGTLSTKDRKALTKEGKRLLSFASSDSDTHDIQFSTGKE